MTGQIILNKQKRCQWRAYIWILPAFALLAVFCFYPPVYAIALSFSDSDGVTFGNIVGFANFASVLGDGMFWKSMGNVFIITIAGFLTGHVANILLAELLFHLRNKLAGSVYRFLFVVPLVVPGIVGMMIWQRIVFTPETTGLVNQIVQMFGGSAKGWYSDEKMVMLTIILTGFPWGGGTTMLIYLAGLQGIPPELADANKLDGLDAWKQVFTMHLPLMVGQLKYFLVTGVIQGLQNFNLQLIITHGGPGVDGASNVPGYMMYDYAFMQSKYGISCAIGTVMFIITLVLTVINRRIGKNAEEVF